MKDISHDEYMDGRLQDPVFAAEYVNAALEDGDCAAVALAMTRVLKARSKSVTVPPEGLEALCRLKPFLDDLGMSLAVTAR